MVFKPSFKYLKNKKINFSQAILKLETLLYKNIYILIHLILYSQSDFDSKKKKSGLREKKSCHLVPLEAIWYLLGPVSTSWNLLETVTTLWSLLEPFVKY